MSSTGCGCSASPGNGASAFAARQPLYERFFFGDPVRMARALYTTYDKEPAHAARPRIPRARRQRADDRRVTG